MTSRLSLQKIRSKLGLTQQQMASGMGLGSRAYQELESGTRKMKGRHAFLAERLSLKIAAEKKNPKLAAPSIQKDVHTIMDGTNGKSAEPLSRRKGPPKDQSPTANGNWRLNIAPKEEMMVGTNFKACLFIARNLGPGNISIVQDVGTTNHLASGQMIVTQLEYGFKFVGAKVKPAEVEFNILPVAPWSFWRLSDAQNKPAP
jgi:transcriptional regulator with XRE-family HTH domain